MESLKHVVLLFPVLVLICGCFAEFENKPPKDNVLKVPDLAGDYYIESKVQRYKISVSETGDAELPFKIAIPKGAFSQSQAVELQFCPYRIGGHDFIFATNTDDMKSFSVFKFSLAKTQLVLSGAQVGFFTRNPDALPDTRVIKPARPNAKIPRVRSSAAPDRLLAFFKLYANDETLFPPQLQQVLRRM